MYSTKLKLVRITTVPISLEKIPEGQLSFISHYFDVTAISSNVKELHKLGLEENFRVYSFEMTRTISPLKDLRAFYKLYLLFCK